PAVEPQVARRDGRTQFGYSLRRRVALPLRGEPPEADTGLRSRRRLVEVEDAGSARIGEIRGVEQFLDRRREYAVGIVAQVGSAAVGEALRAACEPREAGADEQFREPKRERHRSASLPVK